MGVRIADAHAAHRMNAKTRPVRHLDHRRRAVSPMRGDLSAVCSDKMSRRVSTNLTVAVHVVRESGLTIDSMRWHSEGDTHRSSRLD